MAFNTTLKHFTSSQELASIWATGENYLLNQLVLENDVIYRCAIAHTSGATFATDLGAGKWVAVSAAGASGSKNYIENGDFEDNNTTGWSLFNTTIDSTTKIPTGTIVANAAGFNALSVSGSSPLAGSYSLSVSTAAGVTITTTGYGFISDAFTIDREDQAKVMGFSFYYEAVSGTMNFSGTSSNTFAVYIRDVSGGAWIQPAGVYNLVQSSGSGICSGTFQTTATGTQYQIAVLMINTVSAAVSMRFDDFQLGPQKVLAGAAVSDWTDFTPVGISGFSSAPTVNIAKYRRVGGNIEVQYSFTLTGATNNFLRFPIPSGFTIDTTKGTVLGYAVFYDNAPGASYSGLCVQDSGNKVVVSLPSGSGAYWNGALNLPFAGSAAGDLIFVNFSAPIIGLSSNTVMSQDTDTRVVALRATMTSGGPFGTGSVLLFNSISDATRGEVDTHASYNTTTGVYTVPVSGIYQIDLNLWSGAGGTYLVRLENGAGTVEYARFFQNNSGIAAANISVSGSVTQQLKAGDTFRISQTFGTATWASDANNTRLSVRRLSGPATIAASEFVGASFKDSTTTLSSGGATLVFPSAGKVYDSHGGMNTSTGIYTVPVSGKYSLSCFLLTTQTTGTSSITLNAFQTGSDARSVELQRLDIKTGLTSNNGRKLLQGDATFNCLAGDTLYVVGYDSDATSAIAGTRLSITRIG